MSKSVTIIQFSDIQNQFSPKSPPKNFFITTSTDKFLFLDFFWGNYLKIVPSIGTLIAGNPQKVDLVFTFSKSEIIFSRYPTARIFPSNHQ